LSFFTIFLLLTNNPIIIAGITGTRKRLYSSRRGIGEREKMKIREKNNHQNANL